MKERVACGVDSFGSSCRNASPKLRNPTRCLGRSVMPPFVLGHLSPSQISMWRRCPAQYEFRYVKGIISPPSVSLILGSAYHSALEENFKQKIQSQEDLPIDAVLSAYADSWDKQVKERVVKIEGEKAEFDTIDWESEDPGKAKDKGVDLVAAYQIQMAPSIFPMEVEEMKVFNVGDVKIVVRIDLVTDTLRIIDHKTASKSRTQSEMEQELQPAAYGLAVGETVPFDYHIAVKTKVPKIQVITVMKTVQDFAWFAKITTATANAIKSGIFPPIDTGWYCSPKFCGYWQMCKGKFTN
jgi:hypothetical protein